MNYRKIFAKIILLLLVLLPFFSAFPANAALLKVTLKSDYIQINGGGTVNLSGTVFNGSAPVPGAAITFTATPAACVAPGATTSDVQGKFATIFTGPATPPTVVCIIKAIATSGTDTGTASTTIVVGSDYAPLVPLPGIGTPTSFPAYLVGLYELALMSIGIFAMLMILYGGFKYMTSAGNPALMGDAKDAIWSAIFGLILALLSWLILGTVNPELTMIKTPGTAFSPFTASTTTTSENCSSDGNLTSSTCHCIDGATITKNPGYELATCNQACSDSLPIVSITGGGGSGATARATVIGGVIQNPLTIKYGGAGYTTAPTVTIIDDTGSGAVVGAVTLAGGTVTDIAITTGGTNYGPTIPSDGNHHCLKAILTLKKIINPVTLETITIDGSAYNSEANPLKTENISSFQWNIKTDSVIYNGYSNGCMDLFGPSFINNQCDLPGEDLPTGAMASNFMYTWFTVPSLNSLCSTTTNPKGILCPFKYWITDRAGNTATNILWVNILAPGS